MDGNDGIDSQNGTEKKFRKTGGKGAAAWRICKLTGLALAAVLLLALAFRDPLIKYAGSAAASRIAGVPVEIGSFESSLLKGEISLHDLRIANPEGFVRRDFFKLGYFHCKLVPFSLTGRVIRIEDITVTGTEIDLDTRGSETNVEVIADTVKRNLGITGAVDETETAEQDESAAGGKKVKIANLEVRDTRFWISDTAFGTSLPVLCLPVHLTGIGGEDGAGIMKLLNDAYDAVTAVASSSLSDAVRDGLSSGADVIKGGAGILDNGIRNVTEAAGGLF